VSSRSAPGRAALLMVGSTLCFAAMAITIRESARELHAFEIAFFRNLFGLLFALPLLLHTGPALLRTRRIGLYFLRCVVGLAAMLTGFWSLVHLPLAQAVALSYTTPLFVTIGAVLVLGEIVRARRWSAIVVGFLGALVILRPGDAEITLPALVALASAALAASAAISIKFLSRTEPADAIVIWMVLIMTPLSLIPALPYWIWPTGSTWLWLALTGLLGTAGHWLLTRAYKLGEVSALQPINYLQLPVVAGLAWWLYGEAIDRYTVIGAAIIFGATFYIAHREAVLARRVTRAERAGADSTAEQR
jgi:drug/metabolite transporter (DMT)-like permease